MLFVGDCTFACGYGLRFVVCCVLFVFLCVAVWLISKYCLLLYVGVCYCLSVSGDVCCTLIVVCSCVVCWLFVVCWCLLFGVYCGICYALLVVVC